MKAGAPRTLPLTEYPSHATLANALPALGAAIRHEWSLDSEWLTVNHGSYGATPLAVTAVQDNWRRQLEAQPGRFMRLVLPEALRRAASALAEFVGAEASDLAFVENATVGCNAVLRSLKLEPGDEILVLSHVYGAVRNTVRYVAETTSARLVEAAIPFPRPTADSILEAVAAGLTARTPIAVLDHITSASALVLPLERMIALCRAANVPVLVDGAHAPAQIGLDLVGLDADWYVGNCHKWLMAPKGCGFLWARRDRQNRIHPVTISHGFGKGFLAEFDWTGTRDPSAYLAVDAAIAFHHRLGGGALRARNVALADEATRLLADRLGTERGSDPALSGSMGMIRLPLTGPVTAERVAILQARLLEAATDAPLFAHDSGIWLRISAQAYNERADYERLAEIVAHMLSSMEG
ncbi:isopenicillin-N epimerase [Rhizobiales bacterium GAS113]|nr:isopenicillin-N epimerase [Rhizobiales bacterium GAS113]